VEGARVVQTLENQPHLISTHEAWFARSLGLTLAIEASGPNWRHTARLQNLDRHEPDPALFVIPPDYTIQSDGRTIALWALNGIGTFCLGSGEKPYFAIRS
jgi:hypothetical protein